MTRLPEWEIRFYAFLAASRARAFDMVNNNCGLLADGVVRALTGEQMLAQLDIEVHSVADVARTLRAVGGVRGLMERYFEVPALPPLMARRGDIVIADGDLLIPDADDIESLGVADGDQALFIGPAGLQRHPLASCSGCWRVG